jgi:hypothetical protein
LRTRGGVSSRALKQKDKGMTTNQTARNLVAAKKRQASPPPPPAPTTAVTVPKSASVPAVPDNRSYRERYLDEVAPSTLAGRMIKFSKEGTFTTQDDGKEIATGAEFVALCDQTLIGWIRFRG